MTPEKEGKLWTPRPWERSMRFNGDISATIPAEEGPDQVVQICIRVSGRSYEEREANIQLINTSPELYDALEGLTSEVAEIMKVTAPHSLQIAFLEARQTLKKARGNR